MSSMQIRRGRAIWVLLTACFLSSCFPKSTPPGSNSIGGSFEKIVYSYHYWVEGLRILFWHDFSYGAESCSETGSTEDPYNRLECSVQAQDGRHFNWEIHTTDGITGLMWINGQSYNLTQGNMFLIRSEEGEVKVIQLQRDLSVLNPDQESLAAMLTDDRDVVNFYEGIDAP